MKWKIFHFSLDPLLPLRSEVPSYFWLHSMMVNTSPEANCFWKSEILTMKSPTPSPPSEKYFTSLASRYFWDGPLPLTNKCWNMHKCMLQHLQPWMTYYSCNSYRTEFVLNWIVIASVPTWPHNDVRWQGAGEYVVELPPVDDPNRQQHSPRRGPPPHVFSHPDRQPPSGDLRGHSCDVVCLPSPLALTPIHSLWRPWQSPCHIYSGVSVCPCAAIG